VLTLAVIPAIYSLWRERELRRASRLAPGPVAAVPETAWKQHS